MTRIDLGQRARAAVRHFWRTRTTQQTKQQSSGKKDQGARGAVTGGGQMEGFVALVRDLLIEAGLPASAIALKKKTQILPGFFRPTKQWDLLVMHGSDLLAAVEFKSQVGSFGNNFNNRTEEAVGSAHDLWTAYRDGAFHVSPRPWRGYFMLLEKSGGSTSPVGVDEPHFPVFPEFHEASYADRYSLLCRKLVRERLYDGACLLLTDRRRGPKGDYQEPDEEIGLRRFCASLLGHVRGHLGLV